MALPNEVNVGTAPNNGTGDPLRTGGQKINANFAYLDNNKIGLVEKGANNGVATLDSTGKLTASQLPALAITDVIVATENTIAAFAANSGNYTFQQGDVIIIDDGSGNLTHYLYVGGAKTDVNEYSEISGSEVDISQVNGLQAALDAKANDSNVIHKTGDETADGKKTFLKPFKIGSQPSLSANQGMYVALILDDTSTGNGHGIDDNSVINRIGDIAYASFDAKAEMAGTNNYNHYHSFQDSARLSTTGITSTVIGFTTRPVIDNGNVTNRYGFNVNDIEGTGVLENNYGLRIRSLTKGANLNYAIFTEGTTPSKFGGNVDALAFLIGGVDINDGGLSNVAYLDKNNVFTVDQKIVGIDFKISGADRRITLDNSSRTLFIGDGSISSFIRIEGENFGGTNAGGAILFSAQNANPFYFANGNLLINTFTDNGLDKLQVNGSAKIEGAVAIEQATDPTHAINLGQLTSESRLYTAQQGFDEFALTDAATVNWDLNNQVARLLATSAVGNTRALTISNSNPGVNYQLTYIQDATGGRDLDLSGFDKVYGSIDLTANAESIITVCVTNAGTSFVVITSDTSVDEFREVKNITGDTYDVVESDKDKILLFGSSNTPLVRFPVDLSAGFVFRGISINSPLELYEYQLADPYGLIVVPEGATRKIKQDSVFNVYYSSPDGGYAEGSFIKEYDITASPDGTLWKTGQVDNSGNIIAPEAL